MRLLVVTLVVLYLTSIETCPFHGKDGGHHHRRGDDDFDDLSPTGRQYHRSRSFPHEFDGPGSVEYSHQPEPPYPVEAPRRVITAPPPGGDVLGSHLARNYRRTPIHFSGDSNIRPSIVGVTAFVAMVTLFSVNVMNY